MKLCYIQHASEYILINQVLGELEEKGIDIFFVVKHREGLEQYKTKNSRNYLISEIYNNTEEISENELQELDLKYGVHGIKAIYNSDVHMRYLFKNRLDGYKFIAKAYKFWEAFLSGHSIDVLMVRETASFATRTAYHVAKQRGIRLWKIQLGPGEGLFTINDVGEEFAWSEFLEKISQGPQKISQEEGNEALSFAKNVLEAKRGRTDIRYVSAISLFGFFKSILGTWRAGLGNRLKENPIRVAALRFGRYRLKKRFIWKYFTRPLFFYDKVSESDKYVYMPLFSENEAMSLANYHYWTQNQESLVKEISESLPLGFWLYVKEHPRCPGEFSFRWLKNLQRVPSVKIVHPLTNAQELIENSEAVIVLGGTSGWEAYLSQKPVIMLGPLIYFARSRLIYKVGGIADLPEALWRAIRSGSRIYDERKEEWMWFIHAVISTCGKGKFVRTFPPYGFPEDKENSHKMAKFISQKIKRDFSTNKNKSR